MSEQDNLRVAKDALAAINAHDLGGYVEHIADTFIGESELAGTVHGPDGARQVFNMLFNAFPDLRYDAHQMIASGDHVVIRATMSGTHLGSIAGMAPTEKRVSWGTCVIVEMRNGKAVHTRSYADNVTLFRQIGALPMPHAAAAR
jgi:predicted ester cyclase